MGCTSDKNVCNEISRVSTSTVNEELPYFSQNLPGDSLSNPTQIIYFQNIIPEDGIYKSNIIQYNDESFPPELKSLMFENSASYAANNNIPEKYLTLYKQYEWKRGSEVYKNRDYTIIPSEKDKNNKSVTQEIVSPQSFTQGQLGSCYFGCVIASLCRNVKRIKHLFVTQVRNKINGYSIRILEQGQYLVLTIDDLFPYKPNKHLSGNSWAFCLQKGNLVFAMLLEKAWAKYNNFCYLNIWNGTLNEAFNAGCEGPTIQINHSRFINKNKADSIFDKIKAAIEKKYLVCTYTEKIDKPTTVGLVPFHAYSIGNCYEYNGTKNNMNTISTNSSATDGKIKGLKLRNPVGDIEYNGRFSKGSIEITYDLGRFIRWKDRDIYLDEEEDENGTFTIGFDDYVRFFTWTLINKYNDDFIYRYCKFDHIISAQREELRRDRSKNGSDKNENIVNTNVDPGSINVFDNKSYSICWFKVTQTTKATICLHQPPKRSYSKIVKNYEYPFSSVIGVKGIQTRTTTRLNSYKYIHIKSEFLNIEKILLENLVLSPGGYHVLTKTEWDYKADYSIVLSTYASHEIEMFKLPHENIMKDIVQELLIGLAIKNIKREFIINDRTTDNTKTSYCSSSILDENKTGFNILFYRNKHETDILHVNLKMKVLTGAEIIKNYSSNAQNDKTPNDDNVINLTIFPKRDKYLVFKMTKPSYECLITWEHNMWFEYAITEEVINVMKKDKSKTRVGYEYDKTTITGITYNGGYILIIVNKNDWTCFGQFEIEGTDGLELEFIKESTNNESEVNDELYDKALIKEDSNVKNYEIILKSTEKKMINGKWVNNKQDDYAGKVNVIADFKRKMI